MRHALFEYVKRANPRTGELPTLYRVSADFHKQGLTGERLLSGVTPNHEVSSAVGAAIQYMGVFKASRSLFVNVKLFKEYLRGGAEGPCRDFDITKSFSRARAARGEQYALPVSVIRQWIERPDAFAAECAVSVEDCKAYITAAPYSGTQFESNWMAQVTMNTIPVPLQRYKEQV